MKYMLLCLLLFFAKISNGSIPENQQIFRDTLEYIEQQHLPSIEITPYIGAPTGNYTDGNTPQVYVIDTTTFKMTQQMVQKGYKPLVLDMANKSSPGGSVLEGSNAQEETLCRESNLFKGLKKALDLSFYPLPEEGGILLTNVTFFRDDEYNFLEKPFQADVFASAAFDCNPTHKANPEHHLSGCDRPENDLDYKEATKRKMRAMFQAAKQNGNDAVVLGAFGCGAFENDPYLISEWYKEVLNEAEFQNVFKIIIFAIRGAQSDNFKAFTQMFNSNQIKNNMEAICI